MLDNISYLYKILILRVIFIHIFLHKVF